MDENFIENAEALELAKTEDAIRRASNLAIPSTLLEPKDYKFIDCQECGGELPLFRKQRGLPNCVGCQAAIEKLQSRLRGVYAVD